MSLNRKDHIDIELKEIRIHVSNDEPRSLHLLFAIHGANTPGSTRELSLISPCQVQTIDELIPHAYEEISAFLKSGLETLEHRDHQPSPPGS